MKKLYLIPLLIASLSCDSGQEEVISLFPSFIGWNSMIEEDEIYNQLLVDAGNYGAKRVTDDINIWLSVFVQDAERVAGLDLSYVFDGEVILIPSSEIPNAIGGFSWSMCDDKKVQIGVQDYILNSSLPNIKDEDTGRSKFSFSTRIWVYYHEFGHDILNLLHTCNQNDVMFNNGSEEYPCNGELIKLDDYSPTHPQFTYKGFIAARDRMFKGVEQYYYDCN